MHVLLYKAELFACAFGFVSKYLCWKKFLLFSGFGISGFRDSDIPIFRYSGIPVFRNFGFRIPNFGQNVYNVNSYFFDLLTVCVVIE